MNIVPEMRNMLLGYGNSIIDERVNQLIGLCEDSLRRHIGNLERAIEHERKGIFNPITCLGEGIRWIVGLPVDILQWAGLYSAGRSGKIKASFLFRVISNMIVVMGLISSIVTIVLGWDEFVAIIHSCFWKK